MTRSETVWASALAEFTSSGVQQSAPRSFQDYVKGLGISADTAQHISIDALHLLPACLREAGVMVLRMGRATAGSGTQFVMAKHPKGIGAFFLDDQQVFAETPVTDASTSGDLPEFYGHGFAPKIREVAALNVAISHGLFNDFLDIEPGAIHAPAMGTSTYTFDARVHQGSEPLEHRSGQVEIDALFFAERRGRPTLFVVEAKFTDRNRSLAKHKLMYPWYAMDGLVDHDIAPLYLSVLRDVDGLTYRLAECRADATITGLRARHTRAWRVSLG